MSEFDDWLNYHETGTMDPYHTRSDRMASPKKKAAKKKAGTKGPTTARKTATGLDVDPNYVESQIEAQSPIVDEAKALVVSDQASMDRAGVILKEIVKPMMAEIHETLDPICTATNEAHSAATTARKNLLAPYVAIKKLLGDKVTGFLDAEDRRVKAEQAELDRVHREKLAKEAKDLKDQEEADELARRQTEHDRLAGLGEFEAAEAALRGETVPIVGDGSSAPPSEDSWEDAFPEELPEPEPAPVARSSVSAPKGISTPKRWKAEVKNPMALVKAIADGKAPLSLIQWDMKKLNDLARAMDGKIDYDGVTTAKVSSTSVR